MFVQYNAYVTKKVQCFKYVEYANDLMIGDYVDGCNGFTMVDREPKTVKAKQYYVLEHNGRTTMLEPNTYVKMADGDFKLPEELCKGDMLFPKQALQYIGHANQPLYMVDVVTDDNTIKVNGLYIKEGK